jgi:hypothetical protein
VGGRKPTALALPLPLAALPFALALAWAQGFVRGQTAQRRGQGVLVDVDCAGYQPVASAPARATLAGGGGG